MSDIYQEIWNADQSANGLRPIFDNHPVTPALQDSGFVKVNHQLNIRDQDLRVLPEVHIPPAKKRTYDFCRALFNNYALPEPMREIDTPQEREEVHSFMQTIIDTPPMQVARAYIEEAIGTIVTRERWYMMVLENWFRRFSAGGDPDLSGFEHIIVGEQQGANVQGYHFWYKYYLDDGFASEVDGGRGNFPGLSNDRIAYLQSFASEQQKAFPESVTISYRWNAPDYDARARRPLTKPKGGFFVGCSVEALMAMGTVRAHVVANAPKETVINGARYDLKVFRSPDNKNLRTFYPVFLGIAPPSAGGTPTPPVPGTINATVRIVGALLNPVGDDPGREAVSLINAGSTNVSLAGWRLLDKQNHHYEITDLILEGGSTVTIRLPENSVQLSNKGGEIRLVNPLNQTVHRVSYTREQAMREGETILF